MVLVFFTCGLGCATYGGAWLDGYLAVWRGIGLGEREGV